QALRLLDQLAGPLLRGRQAVQRRIGGLLLALVAAGRFPELREAAFDVEDIIDDLERESEGLPGPADRLDVLDARAGQRPAPAERRPDERGRLVQVYVVEHRGRDGLALRLDVDHLP